MPASKKSHRFEGIFNTFDDRAKMLMKKIDERAEELGDIPPPKPPKERKPIMPFNAQQGPF